MVEPHIYIYCSIIVNHFCSMQHGIPKLVAPQCGLILQGGLEGRQVEGGVVRIRLGSLAIIDIDHLHLQNNRFARTQDVQCFS